MHLAATQPNVEAAQAPRIDLEALVRAHQAGVWRYLRSLGCASDQADDLTQDTFLVALDKGFEDSDDAATRAYLRRTARFLWLRGQRKARRRAELLAAAVDRLWERDCERDDGEAWLEALRSCVAGLRGRARSVVQWVYCEGQSRGEVARALGMRRGGVKTLLRRVRQTLRECVRRKLS